MTAATPSASIPSVSTLGIVGAGTMGAGIATAAAGHGVEVILYDISDVTMDKALADAAAFFDRAVEKGRMEPDAAETAKGRMTGTNGLAALADADLVIEAVFEDFDLKATLFGELSGIVRPDALVATNTSCLTVSGLAGHVADPGRFLGMHFFSPAQVNPLVEVVRGEDTVEATIEAALAFSRAIGKQPLLCLDRPGFAVNRFFCPYTNEAVRIADEGIGTLRQVDRVAGEVFGAAAGPFQVMNLIKPRINLHAIRNLATLGRFYAPADGMAQVGDADGAWELDAPGAADPGPDAGRDAAVADRLRAGTFLPTLQALDDDVAAPADIDRGAGLALKFGNPPCAAMDALGRAEVERLIAPLCDTYGLPLPDSLERVGALVSG